ncbi:NUDIX domain-containing protein [Faecalibacterium sp. PGM34]
MIEKELEEEGIVPYCPKCQQYRFPMYNVAVSMIVVDEETGKILLIQQYGKPSYILVAGYVNRGEAEEHAVVREVREETGLEVEHLRFNRTYIRSAQGIISRMKIDYCQTTFIGMAMFLLWAVKNQDRDFRQSDFPVL